MPPDGLATLLRECRSLSERALLAASELDPAICARKRAEERCRGSLRDTLDENGQVLLEAVG